MFKLKNQKRIISYLLERKKVNQVDIAKDLSLSLPTIISNINNFKKEGVINIDGVGSSRGGRRPVVISISQDYKYTFGIDFLVDTVRVALFDFTMQVVDSKNLNPTNSLDFDAVMEELFGLMQEMLLSNDILLSKLLGVGISIPGIVDVENNMIEVAPNLHISNKSIHSYKNFFGAPVFFENEANAAAYAEWQIGSAKDSHEVLYMSIMRGVGAGFIINNRLYHGGHYKAGEVGHIIIHRNGRKCTCGELGCANEYLSLGALKNEVHKKYGKNIDLDTFMSLVKKNDKNACLIWNKYIDDFAFTLKTIITTINPGTIVIGGGISKYSDILIPALHEKINESPSSILSENNHIVPSSLMHDASIIGIALYVRNQAIFYSR